MPAYKDTEKKTWYVKFRYKDWKGDTKWVTKRGFRTKGEAVRFEEEFKLTKSGNLEMSFADFVAVYTSERAPRIKESTMETKGNIIRTKLIPYFGERKVCEITSADVMKWQNELLKLRDEKTGKPYSSTYLKTLHNQLSAIFNHAVRFYKLPYVGLSMMCYTLEKLQRVCLCVPLELRRLVNSMPLSVCTHSMA